MSKKKKKQSRNLLLSLAVLLLLIVVYLGLDWKQKQDEAASETEETQITLPVSVTEEELAKVTVKTENHTMTFTKETEDEETTWIYEEDKNFPLKSSLIDTKTGSLTDIEVKRKLENPEDLSEYGLDTPMLEITVEKTDGTSYVLHVGDKNSSTDDYYLQVNDEAEIYTIEGDIVGAFNIEPYDVAEGEDLPSIDSETITSIKVEQGEETVQFVSDEATGLVWTMIDTEGNEYAVDSTALDSLKSNVAGLGFDNFIDYKGEDLEQYGLDEPQAVITIVTKETEVVEIEAETESDTQDESGEEETSETSEATEEETEAEPETEIITTESTLVLLIGDTNEDGNYYAKNADGQEVHIISSSELADILNIQRVDYVDTQINDVPFTDLKSLKVTYQGESTEFVKEEIVVTIESEEEDSTEEDSTEEETEPETEIDYLYMADGVSYDSTTFITFYNNSILLEAQRRLEEDECPEVTGDPDLILQYTRLDGSTLKTEYYLGDDGMYLVLSDQALPAKVDKFDVQAVIDYYEYLLSDEGKAAEQPETAEADTETESEAATK